jgi:hypothetical protein
MGSCVKLTAPAPPPVLIVPDAAAFDGATDGACHFPLKLLASAGQAIEEVYPAMEQNVLSIPRKRSRVDQLRHD